MMRDARALYWHLTAHTAHSLVGFTSSDGAAETKASLGSAICTMAEVGLQNGDLLLFKYWITGTVWSSKQNAAQSETHCIGIRTLMYCNILWALKLSFQYGHLNRLVFHLWRQHHAWYQAQLTYFFHSVKCLSYAHYTAIPMTWRKHMSQLQMHSILHWNKLLLTHLTQSHSIDIADWFHGTVGQSRLSSHWFWSGFLLLQSSSVERW